MLASWNYRCGDCGRVFVYMYEAPRPRTVACDLDGCDGMAAWTFARANVIHPTHSGRKYGEFDPQYGCVVEDYSHRQRLLKERGWDELPPETVEEAREAPIRGEGGADDSELVPVLKANTLEEIDETIDKNMIDRRLTGARERRPMQESWISLDSDDNR